ncbi:MAG: dihydrodipicolinate synthase family protein [Pirellulaceae bacterium]|nr:dihydrodipicolinate synthase family protein [Pirellulaceae bacterium]
MVTLQVLNPEDCHVTKTKPIQGVLPIAHTPFTADDEIDYPSLQRQIDWAYSEGAAGFATGMVSEILRLTADERLELTAKLVQISDGRGAVIMSVGAESKAQAVIYARRAEAAGCDGVMAIVPISTALPSEQVLSYYRAIADAIAIPVVVQDASSYVGKAISLDVYVQLLNQYGPEKILFKPEAAPIGPNLSALRDASGGKARVLEGSGGILLVDSFRRGIIGTMPGMEFLEGIVALWHALQRGDDEAIYRLYFPICALVALQLQAGLDGFLAIEKYILHKKGLFTTDRRREPNSWTMDEETRLEVDRLLAKLEEAISVGFQPAQTFVRGPR